ncbi:hypothetical protein FB639_006224, partial [Coemansia asiatica]
QQQQGLSQALAPQQTQQPLSAPAPAPAQAAMPMPVPVPMPMPAPVSNAQEMFPNSGSNGSQHHRMHNNHNHHHHHQGYYSSNTHSPQSHSHSPKYYPQQQKQQAFYQQQPHVNPLSNSPLHHYPNQQQQAAHSRPQSRPQSRHHSRPTSRAHSPNAAQIAPGQQQQQQHRLHKPTMGPVGVLPLPTNVPAAPNAFPARRPSRPSIDGYDQAHPGYQSVAYLRNENRFVERSKFTTLMHCLESVTLIDKFSASVFPPKGNLYPLYKASEDWIAPSKYHFN